MDTEELCMFLQTNPTTEDEKHFNTSLLKDKKGFAWFQAREILDRELNTLVERSWHLEEMISLKILSNDEFWRDSNFPSNTFPIKTARREYS